MELVSIILPYYKKKSYVKSTINSILSQTYQNFEILIIDDELTSESKKILNEINMLDKRISILKNTRNIGAGYSRNRGIQKSKGKYIAFCDCDDVWKSSKLENQLKFMRNKNIYISHTSYDLIDKNNKYLKKRSAPAELKFEDLLKSCDIGLSTVIIDRKVLKNIDKPFAPLKTKEDYVLWLKLSAMGFKILGIKKSLTSWRKLNQSLSSSIIQKMLDGYRVYRTYLKMNVIKSLYRLLILSFNFLLKR